MAYAGSNGAKMKFVGGGVFAKFGLFCPENGNFAHHVKGIAAMRLNLVLFMPNTDSIDAKMKFGIICPHNCIFDAMLL